MLTEIKEKLKAAGLPETLHTLINVEKIEDADGAIATLKSGFDNSIQSIVDKRVTEGVQTAISNYEKKHGLKNGVKIDTVTTQDTPTTPEPEKKQSMSPEIEALMTQIKGLTETVGFLAGEKKAADRASLISQKLEEAGIKGSAMQLITVPDSLEDEAIDNFISEKKAILAELKVAGMSEPVAGVATDNVDSFITDYAQGKKEAAEAESKNLLT